MSHIIEIEKKLTQFIRKFHVNEIIKGIILFAAFGLLYFLLTLLLEHFLWLQPPFRSILFWSFVAVELSLLTHFVIFPLFKLFGLRNGISREEASDIIGKYFHEIDDKLLNIVQLQNERPSELVLASIEQKAAQIKPFSFKNAIHYKSNTVYLKFLVVPILVFAVAYFIGRKELFSNSFNRVVHYNKAYQPPAPFYFVLNDTNLEVIKGKSLEIFIEPVGELLPDEVRIKFEGQSYSMKNADHIFSFKFDNVEKSFSFYAEANGLRSQNFSVHTIETPSIVDFSMELKFPKYLRRKDEVVSNTGNIKLPEGTKVVWKVQTVSAEEITFSDWQIESPFKRISTDYFEYDRTIKSDLSYQVYSSNQNLKAYEKLNFEIDVIPDEFPKIEVRSDIDSVSRGDANFLGLLTDDHGLSGLQFWYKKVEDSIYTKRNMEIERDVLIDFFYSFPNGIALEADSNYEVLFVAYDNDGVNGRKSTRSKVFYYRQKTEEEILQEIYKEQQENIDEFKSNNTQIKQLNMDLKELNKSLQSEDGFNWNKEKELEEYLEKQNEHQKLLDRNTEKLKQNLDEIEDEGFLEEQKEEIKKRLDEIGDLDKKKRMLEDLKILAEKLQKEGLLDQLDKLNEMNEQQEKSLERILELTKQFYVDRKMDQLQKSLEKLSKEQEDLFNSEDGNIKDEQEEINRDFEEVKDQMEKLKEENKDLSNPRNIPVESKEMKSISDDLQKALDKLENEEKEKQDAKPEQKKASQKMKELAEKLKSSMEGMQMEQIQENIDDLERILNNLLVFSYDQEDLMNDFKSSATLRSDYPEKIKKQYVLKENFEHIDDSLYALSLRVVQISSKIQENLSEAHYNLEKSLENLAENKVNPGVTNQQYTMTAANDLADLLSDVLDNLQQQSQSQGSGKGKKGEPISLPDIIKKQQELLDEINGDLPKNQGEGDMESEGLSGRQFEIYREQVKLRQQLEKLLKENGLNENNYKRMKSEFDKLEDLLLHKGLTNESIKQMEVLKYELLKLEKAEQSQGSEDKRQSVENKSLFNEERTKNLKIENRYKRREEFLIRRNLPLQPFYQEKVNDYFNNRGDD